MITHVGNVEEDWRHFTKLYIRYMPNGNTLRICAL